MTYPSRPLSQSTSEVTRLVPRPKGVAKSSSSAGQSRTVSSSPPAKSSLVTITRANPLNGNAAGSIKSERKRNQKGVSKSSDDLAGINVKQLGDLLKLLLQLLNLLGSGSGGGNTLQQLLSLGMSAVHESHGTVSPKKEKKT